MAGIMMTGVRIENITVQRKEDGSLAFTGSYSLMASNGNAMAKQNINGGYGSDGMTLTMSADVAKCVRAMAEQLKKEIEIIIGINEEVK